jgi:hypothetical protein
MICVVNVARVTLLALYILEVQRCRKTTYTYVDKEDEW